MTWGVLERNINVLKAASAKNKFSLSMEDIANFIIESQKCKLDAHVIVGGQNGMGKSYLELALAKTFLNRIHQSASFAEAETAKKLQFFFSYHTRQDLVDAIKEKQHCVFVIDELKPFFDYKRSMSIEQTELYNTVEIARSHSNVFVGAARDYTKLDLNYRNAKAQLLIYLIDKVVDFKSFDSNGLYKTKFTYGACFVGNPSLEYEDKFMFSALRGYSMESTKYLAEKLPTWVGNIVCKDVSYYGVTPDDLALYEKEKEVGIKDYRFKRGREKKALKGEKAVAPEVEWEDSTEKAEMMLERERRKYGY